MKPTEPTSLPESDDLVARFAARQYLPTTLLRIAFLLAQELALAAVLYIATSPLPIAFRVSFTILIPFIFIPGVYRTALAESGWLWENLLRLTPFLPRNGILSALRSRNDRTIDEWKKIPIDSARASQLIRAEGVHQAGWFLRLELLPPFISVAFAVPPVSLEQALIQFMVVNVLYNFCIVPIHLAFRIRRESWALDLGARLLVQNMNRRSRIRGDASPPVDRCDLIGLPENVSGNVYLITLPVLFFSIIALSLAVSLPARAGAFMAAFWIGAIACVGLILASLIFGRHFISAWKRERTDATRKFQLLWNELWPSV